LVWKLKSHVPRYASPILVDGLLYMVADESFVTCAEAASGQTVWMDGLAEIRGIANLCGRAAVFFQPGGGDDGDQAGRTFEALTTNTLESGLMASPSASGKAFYLRTKTDLYRVEDVAGK